MKTITIGRGEGCNIILDDPAISRRHAILRISTFGQMEIVDMSTNGTTVNNVRLRPNVPFPVKRKDRVLFAGVRKLDWKQVPDNTRYLKWGIAGVLAIAAIVAVFSVATMFYGKFFSSENVDSEGASVPNKVEALPSKPMKSENMDSIIKSVQQKDKAHKQAEEARRHKTDQNEKSVKEKKNDDKDKRNNSSKPKEKKNEQSPSNNIIM